MPATIESVTWTTDAVLRRAASLGTNRPAAILAETGAEFTYGQLDSKSAALASSLAAMGIAKGERVAVLMANALEYLVAYHGIARSGAIFVPLVTQSKFAELEYFLSHSEAVVLIVDAERWQLVGPAIRDRNPAFASIKHIVHAGSDGSNGLTLDGLMANAAGELPPPPRPDDAAAFMYTSGSTGRPKAVIHSHYTAIAQAEAVASRMGYTQDDRLMTVFPLFHGNALVWSALAAVWAGACVIIHQRFSASTFWKSARRYRATEVNLLPGAINMILAQPELADDRDHSVRLVLANVTETIHRRFVERFNVDIVSTWALAEGPLGTMTAPGHGYRAGEIGWPMGQDNEIRVVDSNDEETPDGHVGELVQRNRAVMLGYFKNEAETERVLRGGWMHSGDLGYRDSEGRFYFTGRAKHVIRRSGENVSGEEVEECLLSHSGVAEVAVFAVTDDVRGEEVKACVVLHQGIVLTAQALTSWCAERLADFKVPRFIEFLPALPRTGPLKVDRPALQRAHDPTRGWDRMASRSRK